MSDNKPEIEIVVKRREHDIFFTISDAKEIYLQLHEMFGDGQAVNIPHIPMIPATPGFGYGKDDVVDDK
jgi:hypothetical protein